MKTIRVTAMLVLGLAALRALAQEAVPTGNAPAAKPEASAPSTESTTSTDPKPGEERTFAGIAFVWIPAGSFMMGSPASENGHMPHEGPQHKVTFAEGFWMGKYEVTQGEWRAVMGDNPSKFKGSDRLPVENVSWDGCQVFSEKLNAKGQGTFRLPSEAEWEYACRAGTTTPFHFGETISTDQANYDGNYTYPFGRKGVYREITTEVGSFAANAWGLCDMHGNVWEWCDNKGPDGSSRILRGGSWDNDSRNCRAANRYASAPDVANNFRGFRLVFPDLP